MRDFAKRIFDNNVNLKYFFIIWVLFLVISSTMFFFLQRKLFLYFFIITGCFNLFLGILLNDCYYKWGKRSITNIHFAFSWMFILGFYLIFILN